MTFLIYDAVIALVLALLILRGYRKGLILTLCGLLALFVAIIGARIATDAFAPTVSGELQPRFSAVIENQLGQSIDRELDDSLTQNEDSALGSILKSLGLYDKVTQAISDAVAGRAARTVSDVSAALARAVADVVASVLVFCVAFVLIYVLWFLLSRVLDLAARLPVLNTVNRLLGGLIGLAEGMLLMFLIGWVLRVMGDPIPQETVDRTVLLRFFLRVNPMQFLTGI